ncbi:MAG: carboxypeptidase regulatory-like domain-containing protein [Acidobacteria bacterium]|nr:carboxypeptidase regulatory-like domain-containing protein [Acidobacteriota bacterium]
MTQTQPPRAGVLGADVLKCWVLGCWVLMCSGAVVLVGSVQDLGTGVIAGVVRDVTSGQAVEGVTVTMTLPTTGPSPRPTLESPRPSPPPSKTVRTDSQGRFAFSALAAGRYTMRVQHSGYAPVRGAAVTLNASQVVPDVILQIGKHGSISGTVRDDAGDPVVGVSVRTFSRRLVGFRLGLLPRGTAISDDRGQFRIADLPPGDYLACACARDPLPIDKELLERMTTFSVPVTGVARQLNDTVLTFAPTFHTGSTRVSDAVPITVGYADDRTGVDITMRPESPRRVSGQIAGGGANAGVAYSLLLFPEEDDPAAAVISEMAPVELTPEGTFHFAAVTPGKYTLEAFTKDGTPGLSASVSVIVGDRDLTDVVVPLNDGTTVRGHVYFSGSAAQPGDAARRPSVGLMPIYLTPGALISIGASGTPVGRAMGVGRDGSFTISRVRPGRYLVSVVGLDTTRHTLESVRSDDGPLSDAVVDVPPEGIENLVVTMSNAALATLEATVVLGKYELPNEMRVALFPVDRTYWSETFLAPGRFTSGWLTASGTVTFPSVPPGDYYVSLMPTDSEPSPERMTEWAKSAAVVRLRPGEKASVTVKR